MASIYGPTGISVNSDLYPVLHLFAKRTPMPGLFNTSNEDLHRRLKKHIAGIHPMSETNKIELYVKLTAKSLLARMLEDFTKMVKPAISEFDCSDSWMMPCARFLLTLSGSRGCLGCRQDHAFDLASLRHAVDCHGLTGGGTRTTCSRVSGLRQPHGESSSRRRAQAKGRTAFSHRSMRSTTEIPYLAW